MVRLIVSDEEFGWGLRHTGVCMMIDYCLIVEVSLGELLRRSDVPDWFKEWLRTFFGVAVLATPDHVSLDNIVFYFVDNRSSTLDYIKVIVEFRHFEHHSREDLHSILVLMDMLSYMFRAEEVCLQEANMNMEYIIITLYIDRDEFPLKRFLVNAVYEDMFNDWNLVGFSLEPVFSIDRLFRIFTREEEEDEWW